MGCKALRLAHTSMPCRVLDPSWDFLSSHVISLSWLISLSQFCFFISELQPEHRKPLPSFFLYT